MERPPGSLSDTVLVAAGGAVLAAGGAVYAGARLSGAQITGGLDVWLQAGWRLASGHKPDDAWGPAATGLPATWWYWTCTAFALLLAVAVAVVLVVGWRRLQPDKVRRRFGQEVDAREATAADLAPLRIDKLPPPTGRMLLGNLAGTKVLLATEDRHRDPLKGKAARRQGGRGSVALIGPTGSGKTALAATAMEMWDGPVVAVSVKRDVYDITSRARRERGEIAVFDPGGATNLPTVRWSPLSSITTATSVFRVARSLALAIPKSGVNNADYWSQHGESLLGAFLATAGVSRLAEGRRLEDEVTMEQVAHWITAMVGGNEPAIEQLISLGSRMGQPLEVRHMARHAGVNFTGLARQDPKVRSSVYTTAALAVKPWLEPSVAHSASTSRQHAYNSTKLLDRAPKPLDLDWLMGGGADRGNTLYIVASQSEFERLSPVLGGLLADLKDQIHANDIAGGKLSKPLMIVIDEAGQLELGWLPAEVSTIAALGAFFVTCWQSISQINHRYDTLADTVLAGHRTKCFFAGIDDLATINYLTRILGQERVQRWTVSHDSSPGAGSSGRGGRRSVSSSTQREDLASANAIRQIRPGEAVLLHGTLPPAHLVARSRVYTGG